MPKLNVGHYYKSKDGKALRFAGMRNDTEGVFLDKSGDVAYVNIEEVEKYEDGGLVGEQNKEMLMNQAVELKHHADELMKVLENVEKVDSWVVAKAEVAATYLSDITHYLDGRSHTMESEEMEEEDSYGKGGKVPMSDVTEMIELAQSMNRSDVRKAKMMFDKLTPAQKRDFKRQLDEGDAADEGIYEGFLYLISDENPFYKRGGMMGMGGATFSDKVKSISGSLEGRSVPSGYRSEYGRRYNKSEAKEAAQRIAGSMRKKGY